MQPSIAERAAYGTPLDPVADDTPIHLVPRSGAALVGRILISAIFIVSAIGKLSDPATTIGYMQSAHVPYTGILVYVASLAELLGGLAILFGFLSRLGAIGLFIYLIPTTYFFHGFWRLAGAEQQMQLTQFLKNLAIMGGLLLLFARGPGRYSIDAKIRRPKEA
jgi:putative oxidoreductase